MTADAMERSKGTREETSMLHRRAMLATPFLAALPLAGRAQPAWPDRPVRVIVGFPPGGSLDVMTRLAAEQMAQRLGQPFVVETRSGASGNIGMEALARANPDGYTIGTISMHNLLINPLLFKKLPYDPERDFAWISAMWDLPNVAVVPAQLPARSIAEFAAWAKQRPNGVSYGSSGVGTTIHLSGAYLAGRAGFEAQHVTFRGAAQTIPALLSGDIQYAVDNLASYVGVIQEGRMRALAVSLPERWPALPDVPTMAEAGLAEFRGLALAHVGGAARHAAGRHRPALGRDPRRLGRPGAAEPGDRDGRAADGVDARRAGGAAGPGEADLGRDGEGQRGTAGIARRARAPGPRDPSAGAPYACDPAPASLRPRARPEAPAPPDRPPDAQADPAPPAAGRARPRRLRRQAAGPAARRGRRRRGRRGAPRRGGPAPRPAAHDRRHGAARGAGLAAAARRDHRGLRPGQPGRRRQRPLHPLGRHRGHGGWQGAAHRSRPRRLQRRGFPGLCRDGRPLLRGRRAARTAQSAGPLPPLPLDGALTAARPPAAAPLPAPAAPAATAPIAGGGRQVTTSQAHPVNIRNSPGGGGAVVRVVPRASTLRVFNEAPGGWLEVGEEQPFGWVHSSVLDR